MIGGASISWSSRKQSIMVLSSCEVECINALYAACQATWIKMLLEKLKIMELKKMKFFVDNTPVIDLTNHHVCHGRSKNIERRHHFLRDQVNKGKLEFEHCKSE